jgi:hypothetical protein
MSKLTDHLKERVQKREGSIAIPTHLLLWVASALEQAQTALSTGNVETAKQLIEETEFGIFQVITPPDPKSQQTVGFEIVNDQQSFEDIQRKHEQIIADVESGKPIPPVDPLDFKKMWRNVRRDQQKATDIGVFQSLELRSMNDVPIIGFRVLLLEMLLSTGRLKVFEPDTKAEEAAMSVAATFPFVFTDPKKPDGTLFDSFDVGAFVNEVQQRANLL